MLLQLRLIRNGEQVERRVYRFEGNIIRVSWENDGRLVAGRTRQPFLVFYRRDNGCRVRCVPPEALKLNGVPLEREQRFGMGDQIERSDGLVVVASSLNLGDATDAGISLFANSAAPPARILGWLLGGALAVTLSLGILGFTLGLGWGQPDAAGLLNRSPRSPIPSAAITERTVREVALEIKETLWQASESRTVSVEELLVELAGARRIAQQLARLHSEDDLAVTVATAVNSFYQLSAGLVAEDPEAFQTAVESARRCLGRVNADPRDELVLFYRALAGISQREALAHLAHR